jgi:hypothetical protein
MASNFEVSSFQNNNAACIVPYNAFLSLTHRTDFPLIVCTYFQCIFGSNWTSNSAIVPSSLICTNLSISACMNAPGMSNMATSRFSFALMTHDRSSASMDTVGELASSFDVYALCFHVYALCFLPSAHPRPLIFPHLFFFLNMRYKGCLLLFSRESLSILQVENTPAV